MYSTSEVLRLLRHANPHDTQITEDRLRYAIRSGRISSPPTFAARYLWSADAIGALARALRLREPEINAAEARQP